MQWDHALEGYWLAKRQNMSKSTVSDYTVTFRRFGAWIDGGDVFAVKPRQVQAFLLHLQDDLDLAPKTCANAWIALSSFWSWLHEEFDAPHVLQKVARPKFRRKPPDPYTEDDVRRLVAACATFRAWDPVHSCHVDGQRPTAARDTAIMVMLVATGMRVGELVDLNVGDYGRKRGRVVIRHGKGDKMRVLFAGDAAMRRMWRYLMERGSGLEPGDPLFASSTGGRMTRSAVQRMVERAGDRAGVSGAHPHRFRHTFAINFLRNGGNVLELKAMLGHEKMETVMIYARLAEVDLEVAQRRHNVADTWHL